MHSARPVKPRDPTTAAPWDAFWADRELDEIYPAVSDLVGELRAVLGDVDGLKILEVGPGSGRESGALARLGADVVMLDVSPEALRLCRRAAPGAVAVLGDAMSPPLEPESFDVVFHQGLLEHFPHPERLVRANLKLLRPGGVLLIDVPQRWHVYTLVKHALMALGRWFAGWEREFSPAELTALMVAEGLQVERVYGYFMRPSLAYRMLREALKHVGIRLPLRPLRREGPVGRLFRWIERTPLAPWLGLTVGVVARRPVLTSEGVRSLPAQRLRPALPEHVRAA